MNSLIDDRIVYLTAAENTIIQNFLQKEIIKSNQLNFVINSFVDNFICSGLVPIDLGILDKINNKVCNSLSVLFPVTGNRFSAIANLINLVKVKKILPNKIIFFEKQTIKVEEWIKSELPIFQEIPIDNVYNMNENLCRIIWRVK